MRKRSVGRRAAVLEGLHGQVELWHVGALRKRSQRRSRNGPDMVTERTICVVRTSRATRWVHGGYLEWRALIQWLLWVHHPLLLDRDLEPRTDDADSGPRQIPVKKDPVSTQV